MASFAYDTITSNAVATNITKVGNVYDMDNVCMKSNAKVSNPKDMPPS